MDQYVHYVSGFFGNREPAQGALERLVEQGFPRERLTLLDADSDLSVPPPRNESNQVLTNMLAEGAIGTLVGTGVGALAQVALVSASVSLFIASPLVAPLVMLGWGASLGGLIGAAVGAQQPVSGDGAANAGPDKKDGWLDGLVRDAIASGQVVLIARSLSPQETAQASKVIEALAGESQDVAALRS